MRLIFDAHADLAWIALAYNRDLTESLAQINQREIGMKREKGWGDATSCLPEMRRGAIAVCQGVVFARTNRNARPVTEEYLRTDYDYLTQSMAYAIAQGQLAYYRQLEAEGQMKILRTPRELDEHWQRCLAIETHDWPIGNIIAMEGADPIICPGQVEQWFASGLRSVMLSHYGKSQYAVGTGDDGPLTSRGKELLKEFERIGMILDVSHLSDQSFFEALKEFNGPVMASHSNCRALVPGNRQLTDEQIRRLIARDAVIGIVCDAWMLVPGWEIGVSQPDGLTMSSLVDQIDHVCQLAGNVHHVGLGSDVGAAYGTEQLPTDFKSIADLQGLTPLLTQRGYSRDEIDNIFHGNWLRYFRHSLPTSV
jgi:membrane dipeptidase